ncbi:hypothetical protein [Brevundimonas lenta]|uniref:Lipoprotein n=1 Tax=Brevundimonas lenta TaxID=424796 RepID=A0A7W6JCE6_9CAUL|nr:hypothetical protein [Brevundimonas lenta]MBB4082539.1 hypothetical protein [Brevundimonas lenta]
MPPMKTVARQLSFVTTVAAALSISACEQRPQTRICTDGAGVRVPEQNCRRSGGGGFWYYGGAALAGAAYGQRVSGGSHKAPRGGFGASARGSGGG